MTGDAFGWRSAWEEIEDDIDFTGVNYYTLPNGDRIYKGDKFWATDSRFMIEITSVMTKIYKGVVGPKGEEGNVCIFYQTDYSEPSLPGHPNYADQPKYKSEDAFAEQIEDGTLVPHKGNGLKRPP